MLVPLADLFELCGLYDFQFLEYFLELFDRFVHLFEGVVCHQRIPYQCVLGSACRWDNRIDEHSFFKCTGNGHEGLVCIAYIKRNDGAFGVAYFKTFFAETLECVFCYVPQCFQTFWLCLDDAQCFACCGCGSGGAACAEDIGSAGVSKPIDNGTVCGNKSTNAGKKAS